MPSLLDAALALASAGRAIFPVRNKIPLVKWGTAATTDPAIVAGWWARWPEAGIGMATGARSGVWVVDVDPRHQGDETLAGLQLANDDLPETTTVTTGGGGSHHWFLWTDDGPANSESLVGPGIDVRGEGGYVVVPPSPHKDGGVYSWRLDVPPVEAPPWLLALTKPPTVTKAKPRADADLLDGNRHQHVFRLAAAMRGNGFDEEAIMAALRVFNDSRCKPPLSEHALRERSRAVEKYERGAPAAIKEHPIVAEPLARFSEVLLGRQIIAELREPTGVDPVRDEGEVHGYDDTSGLWSVVHRDRLAAMAQTHDGRPVKTGKLREDGTPVCKPLDLSASRVLGAVRCAGHEITIPGFFAAAAEGIAVPAGFVTSDRTGWRVVPPSPDHRARIGIAWTPDPTHPTPRWSKFLAEVLAGQDDALGRIELLRQWVGACLVGTVADHQRALVLVGPGGNGKSTLQTIVQELFPRTARAAVRPQDFGEDYKVAHLAGVRLNVVGEVPDMDIGDTDRFKALVCGEPVTARNPYKEPFTLRCRAGHLFACNVLPGSQDFSAGFWRRFLVLEFLVRFDESPSRDLLLAERIVAEEMPGVLAWALDGAAALTRAGTYTVPPSSAAALKDWRESADQVAAFVKDRLVAASPGTPARTLYLTYKDWARDSGHPKPLSERRFGERLAALGHVRTPTKNCDLWALVPKRDSAQVEGGGGSDGGLFPEPSTRKPRDRFDF